MRKTEKDGLITRLSEAGKGFLWAVHVIGPDDVYAMPSYAVAVDFCDQFNSATIAAGEATGVAAIAVPAAWLGGADDHTADLARGDSRFASTPRTSSH